ncbi:MAG: AAA family ATPase, partial [Firmicutes bacterium]|nr:AAA family ATPase [Bacillota bacterium]
KKKLELHYASTQLSQFNYYSNLANIKNSEKELIAIQKTVQEKENRLKELEAKLSQETLGAEQFNEKLSRFIGYNEIRLEFDTNKKGYKIIRNSTGEKAYNLSEGEKSAIAFVYFLTKIKEKGNKIEDSIIVIDDPISSFDSNKVFHAYAYLKAECVSAKQLFVLTHNFSYFRLIRKWFDYEANKTSNSKGGQEKNYRIYKNEVIIDGSLRVGCIKNGGKVLKQNSEYDYVFYKVYELKDKELSRDELLVGSNIARKLVEAFLSFKFPKQRGNIRQLLEKALPSKEDSIKRERIYHFLNCYSHADRIDVPEDTTDDILMSESYSVINEVLNIIEELDPEHFKAMASWARSELSV